MYRLFVALRLPTMVREQLLGLMGGVAGARWQDNSQLHLTLRFVGEVDGRMAEDIMFALETVRNQAVELALDGIGTFDRKGRVDALWAGVSPVAHLNALHHKIDHALVRIGLPSESRAYRPHVTLARFSRLGGDLSEFATLHAGLASPPFRIDSFGLFESHLGGCSAEYEQVRRYTLS